MFERESMKSFVTQFFTNTYSFWYNGIKVVLRDTGLLECGNHDATMQKIAYLENLDTAKSDKEKGLESRALVEQN